MAGIYIPGVEMPRCCMDCHYHRSLQDQCILTHRDQRDLWSRPDWCPIIPIPTSHGKLGDFDEFLNCAFGTGLFNEDDMRLLEELVGDSSIIIPASEDGE